MKIKKYVISKTNRWYSLSKPVDWFPRGQEIARLQVNTDAKANKLGVDFRTYNILLIELYIKPYKRLFINWLKRSLFNSEYDYDCDGVGLFIRDRLTDGKLFYYQRGYGDGVEQVWVFDYFVFTWIEGEFV